MGADERAARPRAPTESYHPLEVGSGGRVREPATGGPP